MFYVTSPLEIWQYKPFKALSISNLPKNMDFIGYDPIFHQFIKIIVHVRPLRPGRIEIRLTVEC